MYLCNYCYHAYYQDMVHPEQASNEAAMNSGSAQSKCKYLAIFSEEGVRTWWRLRYDWRIISTWRIHNAGFVKHARRKKHRSPAITT